MGAEMVIKKLKKMAGYIDEKSLNITTSLSSLKELAVDRMLKGVIIKDEPRYEGKGDIEIFMDVFKRVFPKDGKIFWSALKEELELEGYDIA